MSKGLRAHLTLAPALIGAILILAMPSLTLAWQASPLVLPDFSAMEAIHVRGTEISAKVYRRDGDFRTDLSPEIATIYLAKHRTMYRLMFHGTQCIERTGIPPHAMSSPLQLLSEASTTGEPSGTEVVDGHLCKVVDATGLTADGKPIRFRLWEAQELANAPVKLEMRTDRGELTVTYRDITMGKPESALFTPPQNCIPFEKTYQIAPPGR
jgi:hypothetical protein